MNILSVVMACFSLLGALDYVTGNHLKIGKEFEKGIMLLGTMTLSMVGMLLIAPAFAKLILPFSTFIANNTPFDPSIIMGMLLANDMGAAPLSMALAESAEMGYFNGLVVSAMMGVTISFNIARLIITLELAS